MGGLTRLYTDKAIHYLQHDARSRQALRALSFPHDDAHDHRCLGEVSAASLREVSTATSSRNLTTRPVASSTSLTSSASGRKHDHSLHLRQRPVEPTGLLRKQERPSRKAQFSGVDPGPLRAGKGSAYEGGSRVPCIVRWPGKVPAGRTSDAIFSTIDFLPTFANARGIQDSR